MQMTITEIWQYCGCSAARVSSYINRNEIKPVGTTVRGTKKNVKLYELTPSMEEYLRSDFRPGPVRQLTEAERIASGWLTCYEIADMWGCSYNKAIDILANSGAESKWESGREHFGRKLFKIPDKLCRSPTEYKTNQKTSGDWLKAVPDGPVKDMILDERRGKALIGKKVIVQEGKRVFTARLVYYNMNEFGIRVNGEYDEYKHNEAKVLGAAEQ